MGPMVTYFPALTGKAGELTLHLVNAMSSSRSSPFPSPTTSMSRRYLPRLRR